MLGRGGAGVAKRAAPGSTAIVSESSSAAATDARPEGRIDHARAMTSRAAATAGTYAPAPAIAIVMPTPIRRRPARSSPAPRARASRHAADPPPAGALERGPSNARVTPWSGAADEQVWPVT